MAKKAAKKKKQTRSARPSAIDTVRESAALGVRHMSTRDIERSMDGLSSQLEIINNDIEETRSRLIDLNKQRTVLTAEIEGINSVYMARQRG